MLRELKLVSSIIEGKVRYEKHEIEQNILFLVLKGVICIVAVVFLAISLFFWVSIVIDRIEVASLVIALIFVIAYLLLNSIQSQMKRKAVRRHKKDEWLQILILLVNAFIEGFMSGKKEKEAEVKDEGIKG